MSGIINQIGSKSGVIGQISGGFTKIASFVSTTTTDFPNVFSSTFNNYHVVISHLTPASDDVACYLRLLDTSGSQTTDQDYAYATGGSYMNSGGGGNDQFRGRWKGENEANKWEISPAGANVGSGTGEGLNCTFTFFDPFSSTNFCYVGGQSVMLQEGGDQIRTSHFSGVYHDSMSAGGFKVYFSSGVPAKSVVNVYGYG
mgnify:CR=1 FL=1